MKGSHDASSVVHGSLDGRQSVHLLRRCAISVLSQFATCRVVAPQESQVMFGLTAAPHLCNWSPVSIDTQHG